CQGWDRSSKWVF
nr:immunoglobulin light chain junction region [Macaca mulatta]